MGATTCRGWVGGWVRVQGCGGGEGVLRSYKQAGGWAWDRARTGRPAEPERMPGGAPAWEARGGGAGRQRAGAHTCSSHTACSTREA